MAYDEVLARRIRDAVTGTLHVSEREMFGGLAFLIGGHLAVAANRHGSLMVRVAPEQSADLFDPPWVTACVMHGRALRGWLDVSSEAIADEHSLRRWIDLGMRSAAGLPPLG